MNRITEAFESINWFAHSHSNYLNIDPDEFRSRTKEFRESSNKAITMSGGSKLLETGFFLRRMDRFLMDMYEDPSSVNHMLDKLLDIQMSGLEKKIRAVGDLVDVIRIGDDLGTTSGPLIDPELFYRFLQPRYRELCGYVKQVSNLKIFFHTCGSIREYVPGLIEAGIDIINPVQTNAYGMDPVVLKKEFGREITFWGGGIDTSVILPRGTVEEVRAAVLRNLEVFSRDGGFVFAPIHNILPEVPPENIIAAYEAVKEFNDG
jgi:uroporphyrinogen decarboxylase